MSRFFFIIIFLFISGTCFSQEFPDSLNVKNENDTLISTLNNPLDTSKIARSDIDAIINYSAKDSLIYDLKNKKVYLYNESELTYKDLKLDAGVITVNQETMILEAYGIPDTVNAGKFMQAPLMFQGNDKYEGAKLTYNFRTQQGNVSMGFSDAEIGYYFGDKIKKVTSDVLFIKDGLYTTSTDRENPEYYFLSPKMKVIPNDKVIAQSVYVYIEGVPVFWIPFGVFPNKSGRSSGLIPPKFGDDGTYGKYLSRLGYFWAMSNYTDFAFTTSYFSKGRIDTYGRFRYASKYNFTGSLEGGYSRIRLGESTDIGSPNSDAWNVGINHNQQLTPTSRFDAGLTFTSGKNYYNISTNSLSELLLQNVISNVTYAKTWEGTPFALNMNYYRDQNLETGDLRERIPLVNFSISQTYPFESASSSQYNKKLYEYLSFSYSGSILNDRSKINYKSASEADSVVKNFRSGVRNTLNFNFSPKFEFITFSPFFNYNEIWYNKYVTKTFNPSDSSLVSNDANAIKALRYFNTGVSFSTRFVGIFTPRIFSLRGIRHTITPSISYVYQPDFSDPKWGYYNSYVNQSGQLVKYSIFENGVFGSAPGGESQSLAFTIGNVFEMKTYENDSTDNKFQLFNFDAGINYNFAADSLKFSQLLTSFRTNIGSFLNISGGASFNLYKFDPVINERVNQFLINTDGILANITNFSISMSTAFDFGGSRAIDKPVNPNDTLMLGGDYKGIATTKEDEVSFNIPFSGGLGFNYSESRPTPLETFNSSNLSGNIAFNLTEKWRLTFSTSYDIINKQIVAPYITAYRDLNSWEMNFNWYPTGAYTGFALEVRIKAPQLRDIKVSKQTNNRGVFN
ncbi:MAG: LPS-assembly protein LptD [Ignavibacteria bacterium]|nr:LPS-assembly protein LptD [Ignavibacteria bacterium]